MSEIPDIRIKHLVLIALRKHPSWKGKIDEINPINLLP